MLNVLISTRLADLGGLVPAREGVFAPLKSDEMTEIESRFGNPVPGDYKDFVSEYGRGLFSNLVRCDISGDSFAYLGVVYGSGQDENNPFHFKWALKMLCARMPASLLPIVGTAGGEGQICIGLAGEEYGKIYYWDRAGGWEGEADDYSQQGRIYPEHLKFQNVTLLADTFSDFIFSLVAEEE